MTVLPTSMQSTSLLEIRGGIAWLTINRPPLNILDFDTISRLSKAIDSLSNEKRVGVLIMKGAGEKAFSSGVDVKEHTPEKIPATLGAFHRLLIAIYDLPITTVAMVRGVALGGGCELAAAFDAVIADKTAVFGQPEIRLGCFPPAASVLLPGIIGTRRAYEMMVLGKSMTAEEALRAGLVNEVAPPETLEEAVSSWCAEVLDKSREVVRLTKKSLRASAADFKNALKKAEKIYLEDLMKTEDAREGIEAFLQKRPAVWKGR